MIRLLVITHGTKDHGDSYVVREHLGPLPGAEPLAVCESLDDARGAVGENTLGLARLPRWPWDDPVIVESWGSPEDVDHILAVQAALATGAFA